MQKKEINNKNIFHAALHKAYVRFLKIRGQPKEIALGFALGIFIALTPSIGFQTAIAVFLATLLKWNKFSAAVGVWITNPVTAPVIYSITYFIGTKLFGIKKALALPENISFTTTYVMLQKTPEILWIMTVGGIIIGLPLAFLGYYLSYSAVRKYQEDIKGIKENVHKYQEEIKEKLAQRKAKLAIKRQKRKKRKKKKKKK